MGYDKGEKGNLYWIVRNSHGTSYGENGYFKVLAGSNICKIESKLTYVNISWNSWCGEGCNSCNYDYSKEKPICSNCIDGYFYDSKDKKCLKCFQGCKQCDNIITCKKCYDGYYLFSTECKKCPKNCKECSNSFSCNKWYIGTMEEEETFVDDIINEECLCLSKYLDINIFLIFLFLLG